MNMKRDFLRMIEWLAIAVICYALALCVTQPQLQTLFWKLGHVTVGAFVAYWVDRRVFGRVVGDSDGYRILARAIVLLAIIYGVSGGL